LKQLVASCSAPVSTCLSRSWGYASEKILAQDPTRDCEAAVGMDRPACYPTSTYSPKLQDGPGDLMSTARLAKHSLTLMPP
ncbi:hypothetical protein CLOM_g20714, partial [Closterium sp. NIES-68]